MGCTMTMKWSEIRKQHAPEVEARIRQRVANAEKVMALYAAETDPKLRELAETDSETYLQIKQASGNLAPTSAQQ